MRIRRIGWVDSTDCKIIIGLGSHVGLCMASNGQVQEYQ